MLQITLSLLFTVILFYHFINGLPIHKARSDRFSQNKVFTSGGIFFLPVYLLLIPLFDNYPGSLTTLIIGTVAIWLLGLIDDFINCKPKNKLAIQIIVAGIFILGGWTFDNSILGNLYSFIWIVGITNSMNMIDNMDGLAGGLSVITFLFIFLLTGSTLSLILLGVVTGFLIFNFPKAKVFMGDCGAYLLGSNLACLTMDYRIGIMGGILLLAVPIIDTSFVIIRRSLKGKNPMIGGTDHLSHVLARKIGKPIVITMVFWSVQVLIFLIFFGLI